MPPTLVDLHRLYNPASGQIHLHKEIQLSGEGIWKQSPSMHFHFSFFHPNILKAFLLLGTRSSVGQRIDVRRPPPFLILPWQPSGTGGGDMGGATLWGPGGRSCVKKKAHQLYAKKNSDETARVIKHEGGKNIAPCSSWHVSEWISCFRRKTSGILLPQEKNKPEERTRFHGASQRSLQETDREV